MKRLRWMMVSAVFGLLALLVAGSGARAAIYTWVDAKGVTHIQSSPPPAGIKPLHVDGAAGEEVAGPGQKKNSVELYTTSGCSWCKKAKDCFRSQGVPFIEYDVERDREAAARKRALGSSGGVPFAVVNGQKIQGYSPKEYALALRRQ